MPILALLFTAKAKIIGLVLVVVALAWGAHTVAQWKRAAELSELQRRTAEATVLMLKEQAKQREEQAKQKAAVTEAREQFNVHIKEAVDPMVADRAERSIPIELRMAYRERRLSRQRLACAPEQC